MKSFFLLIMLVCNVLIYSGHGGKNYILSEPRSGVNLTLCSLMQIVSKPIGVLSGKVHPVTN